MQKPASATWTVGFPLYPDCTLVDFAGATQIFAFADGYTPVWLAKTLDPVPTTEGVSVMPNHAFDDPEAPQVDLLFIPGGGDGVAAMMQDEQYLDFLRRTAATAQMVGSVCSGAFLAATAGLLDGYRVTTYWSLRENLALFPDLEVVDGYPRWEIHGDRFTGGGISSSLDLALELVNVLSGPEASQRSQLSNQYAPHPPFDSGDPSTAPEELTAEVLKGQASFIAMNRKATCEVVGC
jgi:cyclohexyl-isocyanide hydratase